MILKRSIVAVALISLPFTMTACGRSGDPDRSAQTPTVAPHNAADVMFVSMMIPHHQQAIEMSDMVLAKPGVSAPVRKLATRIKAAQGPEIAMMKGWLTGWGPYAGYHQMHGADDGMLTADELSALKNANGAQASKLFLTGMIGHHQGAVSMAKTAAERGQSPEVKTLAADIVRTQQAEINEMKALLAS